MADPTDTARDLLDALAARRQIAPLTSADPGLDLAAAYRVSAQVTALRRARGEVPVGRKIGFTNRTIWDEYDVHAPIWGPVYDTTLHDLDASFDLAPLVEPRIEPEIILRLGRTPEPGMDATALMACIDAVALGFELVQSLFAGWRFRAPDTVAAFGLHGALVCGPFSPIGQDSREDWAGRLAGFGLTLLRDGAVADVGRSENVMGGGPLAALAHLHALLADDTGAPPLAAGEIVSTGTLTRALPVAPGEVWEARPEGLPLGPVRLALG